MRQEVQQISSVRLGIGKIFVDILSRFDTFTLMPNQFIEQDQILSRMETRDIEHGKKIATLLHLKPIRGTIPARFETAWGTKTYEGLAQSVQAILNGKG